MLDKIAYDLRSTFSLDTDKLYSDPKLIKKFLNNYSGLKRYSNSESSFDLVDIFIDINIAIKRCNFNSTQMSRLELWKQGYTETEIANIFKVNNVVIHNFINKACCKISRELGA